MKFVKYIKGEVIRMIYYILLIIIITIVWLLIKLLNLKNGEKLFLKVAFLLLILFAALRSENVGTDLRNYKIFYELVNSFSLTKLLTLFEPGYALYSFALFNISKGSFQFLLIVTSIFTLIGPYYFIKENSNNYFLSVIVYICLSFYIFTFSGLRQSIALSILLLSLKFVKNKKFYSFILCIALAFCFHKSAIIFLPTYFLNKIEIKNRQFPFLLILGLGVFISRYFIVSKLTMFFYDNYALLNNTGGGYQLLTIFIIIFILLTMFKKRIIESNRNNNLWYNMFYIGIIIQIIATVEGNANRAASYYTLPLILLIPYFVNTFQLKQRKIVSLVIYTVMIALFIISLNGSSLVNTYEFFWHLQ